MAETFKCCKNKANNNWVCIVCSNLFHPSCWKRTKRYEVLNNNLIYCSNTCKDLAARTGEEEYQAKSLLCLVEELQTELTNKNNYIARLKRNSVIFEEDATEMESRFTKEIELYKLQITDLQSQLKQKTAKLSSYESKEYTNRETQTTILNKSHSTQTSYLNCCSQYSQTKDNISLCSSETQTLEKVCKEAAIQTSPDSKSDTNTKSIAIQTKVTCSNSKTKANNSNTNVPFPEPQNEPVNNQDQKSLETQKKQLHSHMVKPRLLVMGSKGAVKNIPYLIKRNSEFTVDINCQHSAEPMSLERMAKVGQNLCQLFTKNDDVLIFMDPRCAEERNLDTNTVNKILDVFAHTNLIFIGAPQTTVPLNQMQRVYKYNIFLRECIHFYRNKSKITFVPMDIFLEQTEAYASQVDRIYKAKQRLVSFLYREHLINNLESPINKHTFFDERLEKLLGKVDNWHPRITTFPRHHPYPSEAFRGMAFPDINMDEDFSPCGGHENFCMASPKSATKD